ncbi:cation:proton antiporter [Limosilactobacillus sp. STM2_1]|uniref:Cation:proton antiporter n=1 Tax=Limosilactobacillus rudii TaxID=2759755 RepID=A0A7W3YNT5_9LACO|nr:cation:proton antiporter [Limosilactobacillus rudii]MBB1079962.1 cation:proton antiporter [Limosilactobacillus rudii]MBB1098040.1 cation:proton antiporter [Limosilactobacillus rudii]MCD7135110.1 cation:proton antiporter [Limosilactobacillus rudii]
MIISITILLVAATFSSIIAGFLPHISTNYISIIIGIILALIVPLNQQVMSFHSEIFMYIVAPLIYFEGQTTRINLIGKNLRQIIGTAVLLVVTATIFTGVAVSLLGVPIAFAFLMGALSTPTDATATESVSKGLIVPEKQENILKMESLFNDATGIILVSAMALWVKNGHLNYQQTILDFIKSAGGGIVIGILAAILMISFRQLLSRTNRLAYNAQNMLFVITPFFVYFIAEEMRVSGIIAVVCAGLMQNSEGMRSRFILPRQYHNGITLMDLLQEILNNIVFVILGLLAVRIIKSDLIHGSPDIQWISIGLTLYVANLIIRYIYGLVIGLGRKGSVIFSLGGVHGAVTLALVYMVISSVTSVQFSTVVLSEMLMIILSMVVPSIIFQFILPHDLSAKRIADQAKRLRDEMVQEGIKTVQGIYLPDNVKQSVLYDLRDQKNATTFKEFWHQWVQASRRTEFNEQERELEQRALLWAFRAERQYLDTVSQKENMRGYVYDLYNDVLLSESILVDRNKFY